MTPVEIRQRLVETLELDLIGPWPEHELATEMIPGWVRPSNWYLTGFLIPIDTAAEEAADPESDDDFEEANEGDGDERTDDRVAAKKSYFPSSAGISTLVPAGAKEVSVTVTWGDYELSEFAPEPTDDEPEPKPLKVWQRVPKAEPITIALGEQNGQLVTRPIPDTDGLEIHTLERPLALGSAMGIPGGSRSISIFLVNRRKPESDPPDKAYAFQPAMEIRSDLPFVPRPDLSGANAGGWDDQLADLHYADTPEFATGHGVSADWELVEGECRMIRTRWIPTAEVEKTETVAIAGVELSMEALGALNDGESARAALEPIVTHYLEWIDEQADLSASFSGSRRETADETLKAARHAAKRIQEGIETLATDEQAMDAFRVANRAVAAALNKRLKIESPSWRAFQLAFILLNLSGIADPSNAHRGTVDLLFFPTGGGKTEAYLGLSAFTMIMRRLQNPGADGLAGAGVSVVMRYTLRLLTLDQLSRAAGLVCALELEREKNEAQYGIWPFEIGLWVGKAATPNILGFKGDKRNDTARTKVNQFKSNPSSRPSPIPIEDCPWCGEHFNEDSFELLPNSDKPEELRIYCTNFECDFTGERPLPIIAVDDSIYRRVPAFLIATVDKFATLPWVAESGALLGGATRYGDSGFSGNGESHKGWGKPLPSPLLAPDLIIQDELHLISGPLGTMAGLYETAIDALCLNNCADRDAPIGPKIIASTATVRRASDQIQAIFARPSTSIFPPPGPNRRDSFFAQTVAASEKAARLYVGVSAQGRNPKMVMRKTWLALLGSAQRLYVDHGGHRNLNNPVDPYMTLLGYFSSLRELGGARRIIEEEVSNTLKSYGGRRRINESGSMFSDRGNLRDVVELTSRVSTQKIAEARRRLEQTADQPDRVDCGIATNMISVGLDIPRLGLMGVFGQPKSAAEYIQATSRVGRNEAAGPGLVVTLLNIHKPRDRSHYERFKHFHATFYRSVEVGSVTPFSARALDRGFAGSMMALARHLEPELTKPRGVENILDVRVGLEQKLRSIYTDRLDQQDMSPEELEERKQSVEARIVDLLDSWTAIWEEHEKDGVQMQYQKYESKTPKPLLREMLDPDIPTVEAEKFRVNRSLRDVEPEVNLFLSELSGKWAEVDE